MVLKQISGLVVLFSLCFLLGSCHFKMISTRITISKVMNSTWFKKSVPKTVRSKEEMEFDAFSGEEDANGDKSKQPETLNAFHIISLSQGFDLSPLFEEKKREEKGELRFATTRPASSVISKLEEVARAGNFNVKKSDSKVRLQGQGEGQEREASHCS
ncbi:NON-SPECIFIC SERINE/THREONINE PROTEIN KINASE [Salix purpurea]|uniref:non-specific serine/threonine protein kinase n=1 Tax=Salix purpurea TaxID=77065 RepID=A0A9Q0Q298_SALPP|nr:NON-SPECIFIC SERINE/THREONINE PROTEIN KINASE [Salix purpurea]